MTDPCIYVDADACPVKAEVARVAARNGLPVVFVANTWLQAPVGPRVRVQVVTGAFDAADDWIVGQLAAHDIVVTSDIPLASRALKKGAGALGPTGKAFTDENIGDALAMRELMTDLRAQGARGGPPPFGPRDRSRFLQELENLVRQARASRST